MDIRFDGKRALVTGAGKGLGRAIAIRLAEFGAKTVALSRSQADLDSLKAECSKLETCCVCLSDWATARKTVEALGHFDLLVNSAGIARIADFLDAKEEDFDQTFDVNVKAVFNVSQIVAKSMVAQKSGGSIVHLSSCASEGALPGHAVYTASKGAVDSLTYAMALELGPHNIRTNGVNPTVIMTPMGKANWSDPAKAEPMKKRIPMKRFGEVDEVVDTVVFLLSDKSSYLNGLNLPIEGGYLHG